MGRTQLKYRKPPRGGYPTTNRRSNDQEHVDDSIKNENENKDTEYLASNSYRYEEKEEDPILENSNSNLWSKSSTEMDISNGATYFRTRQEKEWELMSNKENTDDDDELTVDYLYMDRVLNTLTLSRRLEIESKYLNMRNDTIDCSTSTKMINQGFTLTSSANERTTLSATETTETTLSATETTDTTPTTLSTVPSQQTNFDDRKSASNGKESHPPIESKASTASTDVLEGWLDEFLDD